MKVQTTTGALPAEPPKGLFAGCFCDPSFLQKIIDAKKANFQSGDQSSERNKIFQNEKKDS